MSTTPAESFPPSDAMPEIAPSNAKASRGVIAWSSFLFAVLQSVCTAFAALSGLRLLLGISSLVMSAGVGAALDRFHTNWLRVPMISFALIGSLLNLAALMQVRRLRNRPSARWRLQPLTRHQIRMERVQLVLAITTLILIGIEEYWHLQFCHTL